MTILHKLALVAPFCAAMASPAAADPGRLMQTLLADGWSFKGAPETESPTAETYGTIMASGDGVVVQMQGLNLSLYSELGVSARITAKSPVVAIGTGTPGTPVIVIRDAVMSHDLTNLSTSDCGILDALSSFTAGEISVSFPEGTGFGLDRILAEGLYWTGEKSDDCRLAGNATIQSLSLGTADVGSMTLTKSRLAVDLPVAVSAARESTAPSRLSISTDNLIASRTDGATVQTGRNIALSADFDGRTLSPLLTLLGARPFFAPDWNDPAAFMDMWNIGTLLRADITVNAESLQTMPPALVPTAITSNFANVGLSTLTWGLQNALRLRSGEIGMRTQSMVVGTGLIDVSLDARTSLYTRDQLMAVDNAAAEAPTPAFRITAVSGAWRDFGFDTIFKGIVGLSPQPYFERLAVTARDAGDQDAYEAYSAAAVFFGSASRGKSMRFTLDETSGIDLRDVGRSMAADPSWIFSKMSISENDPAAKKTLP